MSQGPQSKRRGTERMTSTPAQESLSKSMLGYCHKIDLVLKNDKVLTGKDGGLDDSFTGNGLSGRTEALCNRIPLKTFSHAQDVNVI